MRVINLNGSKGIACVSGSWLARWERITGQSAFLCFVKDCINTPFSGGLVQKDNMLDGNWYIVPLCKECAKKTHADLDIWDSAVLVCAFDATTTHATPQRQSVAINRLAGSPS
jgi:hypothetical protein